MRESVGVALRVWGWDPRGFDPLAAVAAEAEEEERVGAEGCRRCRPTVLPVLAAVMGGRLLSPAAAVVAVGSTRVEATPPPEEGS